MIFKPSKHDRPIFGKLASQYNLTYFGTVAPEEYDDHNLVRGLTASPEQVDDNYTSGKIAGFDVIVLQRSHDIFDVKKGRKPQTWSMVQLDLGNVSLPRAFIGGKNKSDQYGSTLASYLRMYEIDPSSLTNPSIKQFGDAFAVYASASDMVTLRKILSPLVQNMLSAHFSACDFELFDNKLIAYTTERPLKLTTIDKLLRISVWLARQIVK